MNKYHQKRSELGGRLKKSIILLGNLKNKKILNIGCKAGWLEKYLFEKGIDFNNIESFDVENYSFPKFNSKFKFSVNSVLDMKKYHEKKFDIAVFLEVIEHIPKGTELIALKNINKSLKMHGQLILSTPNKNFFAITLDPAYFLIGHRHYSFEELQKMLGKTGFKVNHYEIKGGFAELMSMNFYYVFKHVLRSRKTGLKMFEEQRNKEFLDPKYSGFSNIFVVAEKIGEVGINA